MVEHAASLYNRHLCNSDGKTPFEAIHGQRWKGRTVEFGEQVFDFTPKALRSQISSRWRVGTFLGNAMSTNEAYVSASNGDVIRTRSIVRVMEPYRWSSKAVLGVRGTPHCLKPSTIAQPDAHVEEFVDPHANRDAAVPVDDDLVGHEDVPKLDKQIRITMKDLQTFGFSDRCPRCAE
jgi:hypothetical protein